MSTIDNINIIHEHKSSAFKKLLINYNDQINTNIKKVFAEHDIKINHINIVFLDDAELLNLNKKYLQHDDFTDIITFNYSEEAKLIDGELYISHERLKENSVLNNVLLEEEIMRVIIHGCLHLCGYNDKSNDDKKIMRLKEDLFLNLFQLKQESKFEIRKNIIVPRGTKKQKL